MKQEEKQLKEKAGQKGQRLKQERVKQKCAQLKERTSVQQDQKLKQECDPTTLAVRAVGGLWLG